jgi:hypothetical protein
MTEQTVNETPVAAEAAEFVLVEEPKSKHHFNYKKYALIGAASAAAVTALVWKLKKNADEAPTEDDTQTDVYVVTEMPATPDSPVSK